MQSKLTLFSHCTAHLLRSINAKEGSGSSGNKNMKTVMLIMVSVLYVCQKLASGFTRQLTDKKKMKRVFWKDYSNASIAKINTPNTVLACADLAVHSSQAKQYLKIIVLERQKSSLHIKKTIHYLFTGSAPLNLNLNGPAGINRTAFGTKTELTGSGHYENNSKTSSNMFENIIMKTTTKKCHHAE